MSENVGYATLQIIPSMRGVDALITKQLGGLVGIGRRGGADLGSGVVGGMTTVVGGASSQTSNLVKGLVAGGLVGGAALVAGFVGSSIGVAKKFEASLSGVAAVSGATTAEMDTLRAKALQLGADTSFSASEASSAMEELVKAGVPVAGVLDGAADATVALAAAGGVALPEAASIAANAMNQFGLAASDLPGIADQIAGAANASAIDVSDFGLSMSQAGAVANLVGLSFDDTALAITAMGNAGIKGSDAGTSLKTFLMNLEPSTAKAANRMKDLGIITAESGNRFFDASGQVKSMADISDVLAEALKGQTKEQQLATLNTLFGSDAIRAASVVADGGSAKFDKLAESIGKVGAEEVAKKRLDNLAGDLEQLGGSVETLQIKTGSLAVGGLRLVVQGLTDFVNILANPPDVSFMDPVVDGAVKLAPAWGDLVDTGGHLITILGDIWDAASPTVAVLAQIGGTAVIGAVLGLAQGLESVSGFIADNEVAAQGLVVVLGSLGAVKAVAVLGVAFDALAIKAYTAVGAVETSAAVGALGGLLVSVRLVGTGIVTMGTDATVGFGLIRSGAAGLAATLGPAGALLAGVGAATALFSGLSRSSDMAAASVDKVTSSINYLDPQSIRDGAFALQDQARAALEAQEGYSGFSGAARNTVEILTPMKNGFLDARDAVDQSRDAMNAAAIAADLLQARYEKVFALVYGAKPPLAIGPDDVSSITAWVEKLEGMDVDTASMSAKELAGAIDTARSAAQAGTPVTDSLAESYSTLADETSNATEKMKAWKQTVDSILGVQISAFDANTAFAASLAELTTALATNGGEMGTLTEAGRDNRGALSDAAQQALAAAEAYGNVYGYEVANEKLTENRERLIESGAAAGVSREQMEQYLSILGLTPENLRTVIEASGVDGAKGKVDQLNQSLDRAALGRTITLTIRGIGDAFNSIGGGFFAKGGDAKRGSWAMVGEEGPELVQFGADGHVFTAGETSSMLAGVGGSGSGIPDGAYSGSDSKALTYLVEIRQELTKTNGLLTRLSSDVVAAVGRSATAVARTTTVSAARAQEHVAVAMKLGTDAVAATVVGKGDETAGGIGKVEAAVREGTAYQQAIAAVLQADMAHRALGPAGYAEWSVALSNLFQGRTGDVWTPGNDHGPAWDKAPSSEHAPSHTKLRQLTDTASPADGTGAAARRTGPLFTVETLVIEERMDIDRFAQDAAFQLAGAGL